MSTQYARNARCSAGACCPPTWGTNCLYERCPKADCCGSLDLKAMQVSEATAAFQRALLPHDLWISSLPVCLAEYYEGKVRRLRLVLASKSYLLTAEASCLQDGPHLLGHTAKHGLMFGYALDATPTPEWLVVVFSKQFRQETPSSARTPCASSLTCARSPVSVRECVSE